MVNSKDGHGHKDKYIDTASQILSQEILMCKLKARIFIALSKAFLKFVKCQGQKVQYQQKDLITKKPKTKKNPKKPCEIWH